MKTSHARDVVAVCDSVVCKLCKAKRLDFYIDKTLDVCCRDHQR